MQTLSITTIVVVYENVTFISVFKRVTFYRAEICQTRNKDAHL